MRSQLRLARMRAGLSQEKLAQKVGISQQGYANIEHGRSNPSFDTALKIFQCLKKDTRPFDLFLDDFSPDKTGKSVEK